MVCGALSEPGKNHVVAITAVHDAATAVEPGAMCDVTRQVHFLYPQLLLHAGVWCMCEVIYHGWCSQADCQTIAVMRLKSQHSCSSIVTTMAHTPHMYQETCQAMTVCCSMA